MRRFWAAAGVFLGKHVWAVLATVLAITVVLAAVGVPKLEFATGQDSYLNDDEQVAIDNEEYQSLFGGQAMITLFTGDPGATVVDLFTPANLEQFEEVEQALTTGEGEGRFEAVITPVTALEFTESLVTPRDPQTGEPVRDENGDPVFASPADVLTSVASDILLGASEREAEMGNTEAAAARSADSSTTLARLTEALADGTSFENPAWVEFLLVDNSDNIRKALRPFFTFAPGVEPTLANATNAQMVVRMRGNLDIKTEGSDSQYIKETMDPREWENFTATTTGAPVLLDGLNEYLRGGMATLIGIAFLVMLFVLWFVFRVRWRLLALGVVVVGVVVSVSILGILGIPLAIITIAGLPILIGMGIDFAIQVHNRVEEEVVLDKELHPMSETLVNLGPPLVIAMIAAVVAFLSLQISQVPMIRDFGVLLAIGIVVLATVGIVIPVAVLGMREYRNPTTEAKPPSLIERFVPRLGSLPPWTAIPLAILSVAVLVAGVVLEERFEIQTDPEAWVNQDTQVIDDLQTLRDNTGSSSELGFFVQPAEDNVFSDETVAFVNDFAVDQLEEYPEGLLTASSIVTTVSFLMEVPGGSPPLELPPLGADVAAAYAVAPAAIQTATTDEEANSLNLIFRTGPSSLEDRRVLVDQMERDLAPVLEENPQLTATPSGLAVVGIGLLNNLEANRAQLTYLALAVVAVWLLIRFLSIVKMVLAMVPVLLAVGVSSLVVALIGIELSPLTTVSGPLVAAAVTEFSALILLRYLEERRNGLTSLEASHHASARTGRAFVASALTTIGGFAVLIGSALPLLRDFGMIVTLNIAVALFVALVVLPPMLVFADDKGWLRTQERSGAR